jgi:hypothetical protein
VSPAESAGIFAFFGALFAASAFVRFRYAPDILRGSRRVSVFQIWFGCLVLGVSTVALLVIGLARLAA